MLIQGVSLAGGAASGPLLHAEQGLSFWGGVDATTGVVADRRHSLAGRSLAGAVLAIPGGRGSCTGSAVLLELLLAGIAPAGIVVCEREQILTIGALVGALAFGRSLPIVEVSREAFQSLRGAAWARIDRGRIRTEPGDVPSPPRGEAPPVDPWDEPALDLSDGDRACLEGRRGRAAQFAMRVIVAMAVLSGAKALIDVTRAHIDGCIYTGPAGLKFARLMAEWGGRVRVPTTLNAISVDRRRWRMQGVDEALAEPAGALADAYEAMGAKPTFTCAPYLLADPPTFGEQIGWAESNAVVFANSVLGARTLKYPDFLDLCIALTGRAPAAGAHLEEARRARVAIDVERPENADDSFWPLLGLLCGALAGDEIPLLTGLEGSAPTRDDLKAFGAAFAATGAAPMFHIAGVTPEADLSAPERRARVTMSDLLETWRGANTGDPDAIGLVSVGSPHASLEEIARLAGMATGRARAPLVIACARDVHTAAARAGHVRALEAFGASFVTDACWCMIGEPIVPPGATTLMTNSGKYANYAPALVGRAVRFGALNDCIEAAATGRAAREPPPWLRAR